MELKVSEVKELPAIIFNYEEIKKELEIKISGYKARIYTEDTILEAKQDRATLNNLVKAINAQKIAKKNEYMKKYNEFEIKIKDIMAIIEKGSKVIDEQVKVFEEKEKEDKKAVVIELFNAIKTNEFLDFEKIFSEKWLNKTTTLKSIEEEILMIDGKYNNDLDIIRNLNSKHEDTLILEYKKSFDLGDVLSKKTELENIEAKNNEVKKEVIIETKSEEPLIVNKSTGEIQCILNRSFEVWCSRSQLNDLSDYMIKNNIKFNQINKEEK